jgi:2-methylcitrate dehydratase PrpD
MATEATATATEATEILARFAATLEYDKIPPRVREYCKDLFLDALACALAGHSGEETHQVAALAAGLAQSKESSIIGGDRLSLAGATLLNGYLITAVTMCDVHRPTLTHITPEVVPPALAIAERDSLPGRELMVALAAGFESATRVGLGLDYPAFRARGFHGPGVIGPFGAGAAVGRLLKLDAATMAAAFGLAGSQAGGTFAAWRTPTVKFHQCRGALSGLMAALLAQQGFVATHQFLTLADGGLYQSYSNGGRPEAVTEGLGDRWELEQIALRLWPSASTIQGLITAMFEQVKKLGATPDQTKKVRISLGKTAFDLHSGFPTYKGKFQALLSSHYAAAVILHDQELSLAQFEPSRYNDPKLIHFAAAQVEVELDSTLIGTQALVEVEKVDGSIAVVRCEHPKGSPENPLSRAEIEAKFRTYAKARLSEARVEEALGLVSRLEELTSSRELMDVLRASD